MLTHILAFITTFTSVFLKGFQHKNVISGHLKAIVFTSYLMSLCDAIFIKIIIDGKYEIIFSSATGASLGMYISVKFHSEIFNFLLSCKNKVISL